MLAWVGSAIAIQDYASLIPNGNKLFDFFLSRSGRRSRCHCPGLTWSAGCGQPSPFGIAFRNAGYRWTAALCKADSDHDGLTNGEELGDPACKWPAVPPRTTAITNPGAITTAADYPAFCTPSFAPVQIGEVCTYAAGECALDVVGDTPDSFLLSECRPAGNVLTCSQVRESAAALRDLSAFSRVPSSRNASAPAGAACAGPSQPCAQGQYCWAGACRDAAALGIEGAACNATAPPGCSPGLICVRGRCATYADAVGVEEGAPCDPAVENIPLRLFACALPRLCNASHLCQRPLPPARPAPRPVPCPPGQRVVEGRCTAGGGVGAVCTASLPCDARIAWCACGAAPSERATCAAFPPAAAAGSEEAEVVAAGNAWVSTTYVGVMAPPISTFWRVVYDGLSAGTYTVTAPVTPAEGPTLMMYCLMLTALPDVSFGLPSLPTDAGVGRRPATWATGPPSDAFCAAALASGGVVVDMTPLTTLLLLLSGPPLTAASQAAFRMRVATLLTENGAVARHAAGAVRTAFLPHQGGSGAGGTTSAKVTLLRYGVLDTDPPVTPDWVLEVVRNGTAGQLAGVNGTVVLAVDLAQPPPPPGSDSTLYGLCALVLPAVPIAVVAVMVARIWRKSRGPIAFDRPLVVMV